MKEVQGHSRIAMGNYPGNCTHSHTNGKPLAVGPPSHDGRHDGPHVVGTCPRGSVAAAGDAAAAAAAAGSVGDPKHEILPEWMTQAPTFGTYC